MNSKNNKALILCFLVLAQAYFTIHLVASRLFYPYMDGFSNYPVMFAILTTIFAFMSLILIRQIQKFRDNEIEIQTKAAELKAKEDVLLAVRSQLHDYNNHLTVISGALQWDKPELAREYIQKLSATFSSLNELILLERVEIASLILSKMAEANEHGIEVQLIIQSRLEGFNVQMHDCSRILGNLLDNALYELQTAPRENKLLKIQITENDTSFIFVITNRYPAIPPEFFEKVFEPGISTKGTAGNGLGLYIVKRIVEKYGGQINVSSNETEGTQFTVILPRKQEMRI